ncbi:Alpha/beta-hydrolase [Favolaschia claudopus]|uniref:Alpha/beta-hydrolase n=1 Tax=Favolaschia claudopus TaxID=2862362 RepID=A0AAW0CSB2_9AGAR
MLLRFSTAVFLAISLVSASDPIIKTSSGTFVGLHDADKGTDVFKGIRYANPPKRFARATPITKAPQGQQMAVEFGDDCAQAPPLVVANAPFGPPNQGKNASEDCHFLNIWRPSDSAQTKGKKLPVLVYIHGGGLSTGSGSEWDGTSIIRRSVANNEPIIFVSINYRLGFLGFIGGKNVPALSSNLGYADQRLALRWVQNNAAAFGGDASKITISGESVGATSVHTHLFYPDSQRTFRAAIASSGTTLFATPDCTFHDKPGATYDLLGNFTGCGTGAGSFQCLQDMPFDKFWPLANPIYDVPGLGISYPCKGPNGSLIDEYPINKVLRGDFLNVPVLSGTVRNEGNLIINTTLLTLNPQPATPADEDVVLSGVLISQAVNNHTPSASTLANITELYANDRIPDHLAANSSLYNRAAQIITDYSFVAVQRLFLDSALGVTGKGKIVNRNLWGWQFDQRPTNLPGEAFLGACHASDLYYLDIGFPTVPNSTLTQIFQDYFIAFTNHLDPGASWPRYTLEKKEVVRFLEGNVSVVTDDRLREQTDYLNQIEVLREFGRFGF